MLRRLSPLFSIFVLSAMLARAGFADADDKSASQAEPPGEARDGHSLAPELGDQTPWLFDDAQARTPQSHRDWPSWVSAKLDALGERERKKPATVRGQARLREQIEAGLAGLGGRAAVEVRDLDSGAVLFTRAGERTLNPASNQKLVTALAAVELLGPDYVFETEVLRDGDTLVIRGEGDPDLHVRDLHALAAEVAAQLDPATLPEIRRLILDDSAFDERRLGPGFRSDGAGESYIAPSGALALDYGTVTITVTPGAYRGPAQVHVEPASAAIVVENHARTRAGSLGVATHAGADGQTVVEVWGSIPSAHGPVELRRRVADPGLVAAHNFAALLAAQTGMDPLPVRRGSGSERAERLAHHNSAPLATVLCSALRYSNNFTAEQVLRTLAWRATGEPGSWTAGAEVLTRFAEVVSSTPERAAAQHFVNGSGLNHEGRLSPAFVLDVLSLSEREGSPAQLLLASFAKAGGEGTMRGRLSHAGARIVAKTGTYAGASSLSGVVRSSEGARRLGFSILVNGAAVADARVGQDRVVKALLRTTR